MKRSSDSAMQEIPGHKRRATRKLVDDLQGISAHPATSR
jgi:hypothetical protein